MIPILYSADEKDFSTQGLGLLSDIQKADVTEQRNAEYYLEFSVPVFSKMFKEIKLERLVKVDDHNSEDQLFRIKKIDTPSKGLCDVYAEHISRDIEGYTIKPEVNIAGPAQQALEIWRKNLVEKDKVKVFSDITTDTPTKRWFIDEMENPFFCLGGKEGSILQLYKGEYQFDNLTVKLLKSRGFNTGASITYGRNMSDMKQDESIEEIANSIYPFAWKEQESGESEKEREMIVLDPLYVDGPHIDKYAERRVMFVDFSDKKPKDKVALEKLAERYVKDNNVGAPKVGMDVSPILNGQIAKGLELEKFERVNLCDIVTVKYYQLGIDVQAKVNEVTYDVLAQKFSNYRLGDERRTLASSLGKIENSVSNVGKELGKVTGWAQQSADGKNTIFYGKDEPKANKVGDTWFKENPDGAATIHVWDGQTWKEVKTDYTEEFEQLDKELEEQKANIDESLKNAEQAIKDAGFSKEQSQQAIEKSEQAIKDANFSKGLSESTQKELIESNKEIEIAKQDADKAIKDAEQALNDLDNMEIGRSNLIMHSFGDNIKTLSSWNAGKLGLYTVDNEKSVRVESLDGEPIKKELGILINQNIEVKSGEKYQLSVDYQGFYGTSRLNYCYLIHDDGTQNQRLPFSEYIQPINIKTRQYSDIFEVENDGIVKVLLGVSPNISGFEQTRGFYISKWQLLKTNKKVLDWYPSEKDSQLEISRIDGELKSKATQKDLDIANKKLTEHETSIKQNAESIELKANTTDVDNINKKVDKNSASIKLNSDNIILKADKSQVDTINKTVQNQGTQINQNSEQIKLKAEKSYVDTKNSDLDKKLSSQINVQSDKITANSKTITEQGTKIGALELSSEKISSEITEINNQSVGSVNLVKNSKGEDETSLIRWTSDTKVEKLFTQGRDFIRIRTADGDFIKDKPISAYTAYKFYVEKGSNYEASFDFLGYYGSSILNHCFLYYGDDTPSQKIEFKKTGDGTGIKRLRSDIFSVKNSGNASLMIGIDKAPSIPSKGFYMSKWQVVETDKSVKDWSESPLDNIDRFSKIEQTIDGVQTTVSNKADKSQLTQLAGQITNVVKDVQGNSSMINQNKSQIQEVIKSTDGKFVEVNKTINGIQTTVEDKADKSQVTQLSGQITSVVKNNGVPNLVTNSSMINRDYTGWEISDGWYMSTITRDGNGYLSVNSTTDTLTRATNEYLEIRANSILSFSIESYIERNNGGKWYVAIAFYDDNKTYISEKQLDLTNTPLKTYKTFNLDGFTVPSNYRYTRVAILAKGDIWAYFGKPMLSQSDIAIPYRPSEVSQSQITQTKEMINLKVSKGDVVGQLNIDAGQTLIQNNKVVIDAKTTVIKGTSWMDGAIIKDATIGTAQIKNASITNAKIGSVDAGKLTTGTISTGDIKIASTLEMTGENGTLNGHYDFYEPVGETIRPRRFVGSWQLGRRLMRFVGETYDSETGRKSYTNTYFGQDQVKLRKYRGGDFDDISGRIDMSVYKEASISVIDEYSEIGNIKQEASIMGKGMQGRIIGAKSITSREYLLDGKQDLSKFLFIYPTNPMNPTADGGQAFRIRYYDDDGVTKVNQIGSTFIYNATGGGAYDVKISSNGNLKSSRGAYSATTLNASKPIARRRMARSVGSPNILPNVDGVDNLTPSMWIDEHRPKEAKKSSRMRRSVDAPRPMNNMFMTGYTVEDLVEAGLTNAVIYNKETGEPDGINLHGLMPYIFENIKMLKMDNEILRNRIAQLEEDIATIESGSDHSSDNYEDEEDYDPELGM